MFTTDKNIASKHLHGILNNLEIAKNSMFLLRKYMKANRINDSHFISQTTLKAHSDKNTLCQAYLYSLILRNEVFISNLYKSIKEFREDFENQHSNYYVLEFQLALLIRAALLDGIHYCYFDLLSRNEDYNSILSYKTALSDGLDYTLNALRFECKLINKPVEGNKSIGLIEEILSNINAVVIDVGNIDVSIKKSKNVLETKIETIKSKFESDTETYELKNEVLRAILIYDLYSKFDHFTLIPFISPSTDISGRLRIILKSSEFIRLISKSATQKLIDEWKSNGVANV